MLNPLVRPFLALGRAKTKPKEVKKKEETPLERKKNLSLSLLLSLFCPFLETWKRKAPSCSCFLSFSLSLSLARALSLPSISFDQQRRKQESNKTPPPPPPPPGGPPPQNQKSDGRKKKKTRLSQSSLFLLYFFPQALERRECGESSVFFALSPRSLPPMAALGEAWMPGAVLASGRYRVVADISGKEDEKSREGWKSRSRALTLESSSCGPWPPPWGCSAAPPVRVGRYEAVSGSVCRQLKIVSWPASCRARRWFLLSLLLRERSKNNNQLTKFRPPPLPPPTYSHSTQPAPLRPSWRPRT